MNRVFLDLKAAKECKDHEEKQVVPDSLAKLEPQEFLAVMELQAKKVCRVNQELLALKGSLDLEDYLV